MRPRRNFLLVVAFSVAALSVASGFDFAPVLVWNASASAPLGLYKIADRSPQIGDLVLVKPDADVEDFIVARGYLPADTPLLKRVAALSGTEVCREADMILIDGAPVAEALRIDSENRKMPLWQGCLYLQNDEMFLLNEPAKSLDGRYFGATRRAQIIGVAIPVLTSERDR